jgi:F-type H+-transporting ATPase subunit delta
VIASGVSRRYGKALFELASEAGEIERTGAALAELAGAVSGLEEGSLAPGLLSEDQRRQLAKALVLRIGGDSLLGRFLGVVADNDRLDQLPRIHESFVRLDDEAAGRMRITIRSAAPLSDDERSALRRKFEAITGRKVLDTAEVDPQLLGGVTVEAEGRVYDGSIRTQLARLERRMAG